MSSNLPVKTWLSLKQASSLFPHKPQSQTLRKWIKRGIIAGKRRVRLKAWRIGGRLYTTQESIAEFVSKTSKLT